MPGLTVGAVLRLGVGKGLDQMNTYKQFTRNSALSIPLNRQVLCFEGSMEPFLSQERARHDTSAHCPRAGVPWC